jgi:hypothetical protein
VAVEKSTANPQLVKLCPKTLQKPLVSSTMEQKLPGGDASYLFTAIDSVSLVIIFNLLSLTTNS